MLQASCLLFRKKLQLLFPALVLLLCSVQVNAQVMPGQIGGRSMNLFDQADTLNRADSLNGGWKEVDARIYYTTLSSDIHRTQDTSLTHFHSFQPRYPWWGIDLGNYGSAVRSLLFQPLYKVPGLSSGYTAYDLYKTPLDSLPFYNTTNPYSAFSFVLGSKDQQIVRFLHTQNITPLWNFAANVQAASSQGFFSGQTAKNISGSLNTNYTSRNQRYQLKAALLYNRFTQDENGGIRSDSFLTLSNFNDRQRIPTRFPTLSIGRDQSVINNVLSDFDFFARNNYSWGSVDTTYNQDSTQQKVSFTPRFRLQYDLRVHKEQHQYYDYRPDSLRYAALAPLSFNPQDTLRGRQQWTYLSNSFSLNGFLGKNDRLMQVQAGIGNRIDHFATLTPSGYAKDNSFNTYLFGRIHKEAFSMQQWRYEAAAQLYVTGQALGNFDLQVDMGKQVNDWVGFSLGFHQSLTHAPHAFELFASNFFSFSETFSQISTTQLQAGLHIPKLDLQVYGNYFLLANYLYYDASFVPQQSSATLLVLQVLGSKRISFRKFSLDNMIAWQQSPGSSPIHLPALMLQEQLAFNSYLFQRALRISTGIGAKYATPYYTDGYYPYLNQFYTQDQYKTDNLPRVNVFFNFGLHHFRAFVSLDELQQLISRNNINAPGYPAENMMFRFGFNWVLVN